MLKPMLKQVRKEEEQEEEDRGAKAPVLLGPRKGLLLLLRRLGSKSRGYALAGAGVVVGAVVVVSLLSWLAPDSDRPIASPLEAVGRVAGGVLEQVDEQVAGLLGTEGETVLRDVRENLTAVGSRIPWSGRVSEITSARSSASSGLSAPAPTTRPTLNTPAQEEPSSPATNQPPTYAPSPSSMIPPSSTSETPPTTEPQPPATTGEPAPPPPATEEPPTPTVEEPLPPTEKPPPTEEPSTPPAEEPPPTEEPPPAGPPPPTTGEPAPPATEDPPPTTDEPPPQPPRPPTGLTKDAE
jgi:hypothetical protein